jgi:hypothetical protein
MTKPSMLIAIPFKLLPTKPSPKILTGECPSNKVTFSTARILLVDGITAQLSKHIKTKMAPNPSKSPSKSTMKRATNPTKKGNSTASLTNKKPSTPLSHESCPSALPASTATTKSPNHPLKLTIPTIWFSKKLEGKKYTRFQEKETSQSFISRNSIPLEKWEVSIKL